THPGVPGGSLPRGPRSFCSGSSFRTFTTTRRDGGRFWGFRLLRIEVRFAIVREYVEPTNRIPVIWTPVALPRVEIDRRRGWRKAARVVTRSEDRRIGELTDIETVLAHCPVSEYVLDSSGKGGGGLLRPLPRFGVGHEGLEWVA